MAEYVYILTGVKKIYFKRVTCLLEQRKKRKDEVTLAFEVCFHTACVGCSVAVDVTKYMLLLLVFLLLFK